MAATGSMVAPAPPAPPDLKERRARPEPRASLAEPARRAPAVCLVRLVRLVRQVQRDAQGRLGAEGRPVILAQGETEGPLEIPVVGATVTRRCPDCKDDWLDRVHGISACIYK